MKRCEFAFGFRRGDSVAARDVLSSERAMRAGVPAQKSGEWVDRGREEAFGESRR